MSGRLVSNGICLEGCERLVIPRRAERVPMQMSCVRRRRQPPRQRKSTAAPLAQTSTNEVGAKKYIITLVKARSRHRRSRRSADESVKPKEKGLELTWLPERRIYARRPSKTRPK